MKEDIFEKFDVLFNRWVPASGAAETIGGEIVRAVNKIVYGYYNDGDMIDQDYGKETCNAAARFILNIDESEPFVKCRELADVLCTHYYENYEELLEGALEELIEKEELLSISENCYDYLDYSEDEDFNW